MYLAAQMQRSFASLKMTAYVYVADLRDTALDQAHSVAGGGPLATHSLNSRKR